MKKIKIRLFSIYDFNNIYTRRRKSINITVDDIINNSETRNEEYEL